MLYSLFDTAGIGAMTEWMDIVRIVADHFKSTRKEAEQVLPTWDYRNLVGRYQYEIVSNLQ